MCRLAQRSIVVGRGQMHQLLGPDTLRLSPNCVVLERVGLLEPEAVAFINKMAARVSVQCVCVCVAHDRDACMHPAWRPAVCPVLACHVTLPEMHHVCPCSPCCDGRP
jgi:hypothetical protein